MQEKTKEEKRNTFLIYLDDNEQKITSYVNIISKDSGSITFQNSKNIVTLPWHRVLKLKEATE